MAMIDVKLEPSKRDLRVFVILWVACFLILGKVAMLSLGAIMVAAIFTSTCFTISLLLNRDYSIRQQCWGFIIPGFLWSVYLGERAAASSSVAWLNEPQKLIGITASGSQWLVLGVLIGVGVLGSLVMLAVPATRRSIYRGWMFAALPIGWTVSHVVLALVYYLVFTPIGLLLRAMGKDPMTRAFDRSASTYWITRTQQADPKRYFRQF